MLTMIIASGSVASLGFGAILAASNPPTRAIIEPADITSALQIARIQTFRGSLVARVVVKEGEVEKERCSQRRRCSRVTISRRQNAITNSTAAKA